MRYVDHATDIFSKYGDLMAAAYDKANIWPLGNADDGVLILWSEIQEADEAMNGLLTVSQAGASIDQGCVPSAKELGDIKGAALTAIFESLQVIAVCNKYQDVFLMEE